MRRSSATALVAVALLSGCSGTIFERYDADAGSVSMDARQRVILSARRGTQPVSTGKNGTQRVGRQIVCAEPSPDVAATLAATAGANLTLAGLPQIPGTVDAATRYQMAEQAAYIGARNATIQLLRDGLYRSCEAYMNGALGDFGYGLILVNYGKLMVATLTAEGLARPGFVPPAVFGSTIGTSDSTRTIKTTPAATGGAARNGGGAGAPAGAGGNDVTTTDNTGKGDLIAQPGSVASVNAANINDNIENIFKEVVYNLSNPLADGNGTAKATEIAVACMLAMDQSGLRTPPTVASSSPVGTMCEKIMADSPAMIGKVIERQFNFLDAKVQKEAAEARLVEAEALEAERRVSPRTRQAIASR